MTPVLTAFLSIGQGDTMATPLQLCAMAACVANGGKYYQPRIVRKAVSEEGKVLIADKPKLVVDLIKAGIKPDDFELIRKGMWMAVNVPGGTAGKVKMPNMEVAAKTGTAQTIDNGKKSNNSWVISFAPYENPKYAICVLVQNAGSGGGVCGPLVHLDLSRPLRPGRGTQTPAQSPDRIPRQYRPHRESHRNARRCPRRHRAPRSSRHRRKPRRNHRRKPPEKPATKSATKSATSPPELPTAAIDEPVTPTLTPEIDAEGTVIPRAVPVTEP